MSTEENKKHTEPEKDKAADNGGHDLTKGNQPTEQKKPDDERVHTVAPDNDSGAPGPPAEES
ncbi:MAG: hypothetical protein EOP46_14605 [Sphingobacteriaceae bacterium]|nr:MAG: hypothetical protein EOP46_14605 [Sphingobacteriaceae bacterium]